MRKPGFKAFIVCGICTGTDRREGKDRDGNPRAYYDVTLAVGKKLWGVSVENDADFAIFQPGGVYLVQGDSMFGQAEATGQKDNFGRGKAKVTQLTIAGLKSVKKIEGETETEVLPPRDQAQAQASGGPSREEVNAAYTGSAAAPAAPPRRSFLGGNRAAA